MLRLSLWIILLTTVTGLVVIIINNTVHASTLPSETKTLENPSSGEEKKKETSTWRRLTINETVPRGSRVRLDLQTGERFILDDDDDDDDKNKKREETVGERILNVLGSIAELDMELGKRIQRIQEMGEPGSEEFENAVRELWMERQVELAGSHSNETTISQMEMQHLLETVRIVLVDNTKPRGGGVKYNENNIRIKEVLEEIEFRVQDVDDAHSFSSLGGMDVCVDALFSHDEQIQSLAAHVLGSAVKSVESLQEVLMMHRIDVMDRFISMIRQSRNETTEAKSLFALGSLVRGNPTSRARAERHPDFAPLLVQRVTRIGPVGEKARALIGDMLQEGLDPRPFLSAGLCAALDVAGNMDDLAWCKHFAYLEMQARSLCVS